MSVSTNVSEETIDLALVNIHSVVATHDALIELGQQKELKKFIKQQQEKNNKEIINFFENYLANAIESGYFIENANIRYYSEKNVKEIINKSLNHINTLNTVINGKRNKYIKLYCENKNLQDENKELNNQIIELEEKIENYWEKRVEKVRNICIQRNDTIKMFKYFIGFMISQ
jgi:hypothetical protein